MDWISVKDERPKYADDVLVYVIDKDRAYDPFPAYVAIGEYDGNLWAVDGEILLSLKEVTHWQYLPPPPSL